MREKYLPVGTVVLLNDATKKLMITGYCSSTPEDANTVYDYVGCLFPEANLAGDSVALFNHEQIGKIEHLGFDNDEFKQLDKKIKDAMKEENNSTATEDLSKMPPFTPDNINMILSEIYKHGDELKPISEPTAFDEAVIKKPVFDLPSLSGNNNKEESEAENEITDNVSDNEFVEEEEVVPDGQPVLQLEPIFEGAAAGQGVFETPASTETSSSEAAGGAITGLARL